MLASLDLTVIVPTRDRAPQVRALLARLALQTLSPERFEVVVVDDGSSPPVDLDPGAWPMNVRLLRQAPSGPAAARNRAIDAARAPLVLMLNDDALPAADDLGEHLAAHAAAGGPVAVLGTFDFTAASLESSFVRLLDGTSLLFDYVSLRDGLRYDWRYFWTCNLSAPTAALRQVGGFDATHFDEAIVEDVELGFRLQAAGVSVLYRSAARCAHEHVLTVHSYFRRMVRLGVHLHRMYQKHGDPGVLWQRPDFVLDERALLKLQIRVEVAEPFVRRALAELQDHESAPAPDESPERLARLRALCRRAGIERFHAGILLDAIGWDLVAELASPTVGSVALCLVADPAVPLSLGSRWSSVRHPAVAEVVLVGPIDGRPIGVPVRRCAEVRQVGTGADWLLLADARTEPPAGDWVDALLRHGSADPRVACVGLGTYEPGVGSHVDAGTASWARFEYVTHLVSDVALVRRTFLEQAGWPDAHAPWVRPVPAPWRCRLAHDVKAFSSSGGWMPSTDHRAVLSDWGRPWTVASDLESWVRALEPLRRATSRDDARAPHGEGLAR